MLTALRTKGVGCLAILAATYIAFGYATLSIHATDYTDYFAPFESPFLSAITAPMGVVILPALAAMVIYLVADRLHARLGSFALACILAGGLAFYGMRLYFIYNGFYFNNLIVIGLVFVTLAALFYYAQSLIRIFAVFSAFAVYSIITFSIGYHGFLARAQVQETEAAQLNEDANPVVVFMFDEISSYLIRNGENLPDLRRFPELRAFAETATWYPNAMTPHTSTITTVAALLSGRDVFHRCGGADKDVGDVVDDLFRKRCGTENMLTLPGVHAHVNAVGNHTGADLIRKLRRSAGADADATEVSYFKTYLFSLADTFATGVVHPRGINWVLGRFRDARSLVLSDRRKLFAEREVATALGSSNQTSSGESVEFYAFLRCLNLFEAEQQKLKTFKRNLSEPHNRLNIFYTTMSHAPYCMTASGSTEVVSPLKKVSDVAPLLPDANPLFFRTGSRCRYGHSPETIRRSYVNAVRRAFNEFNQALDQLRSSGRFDDATIILMSDHGTGFTGGGAGRRNENWRNAVDKTDNRVMNASNMLFIKYPGQSSAMTDWRLATPSDIGKTMMEAVGLMPPWETDGRILSAPDDGPVPETVPFHQSSFVKDGNKLLKEIEKSQIPLSSTYFRSFAERLDRFEPVDSDWIGKSIDDLTLDGVQAGQIESLRIEPGIIGRDEGAFVAVLTGHSVNPEASQPTDRTYIAVNGLIVDAVYPCLIYKPRHHKWATVPGGWAVTLPANAITEKSVEIRAFSPSDAEENRFHELARPIQIELTSEQLRLIKN